MAEPWAELITVDGVLALHIEAIKRHGGDPTTRKTDVPCVEGKVGGAWTAEGFVDRETTGLQEGLSFAGYLLYYLAKGHCFTDGNKRVSWTSAMLVLAQLGLTVTATDDEAEAFILDLIQDASKDGSAAVTWLAERLVDALPRS
jgi:death-on-curing protein